MTPLTMWVFKKSGRDNPSSGNIPTIDLVKAVLVGAKRVNSSARLISKFTKVPDRPAMVFVSLNKIHNSENRLSWQMASSTEVGVFV